MKIRIQGQSLRFRLSKTDIAEFEKTGSIIQFIQFGQDKHEILFYSLTIGIESNFRVEFSFNKIVVEIPKAICMRWFNSDQVGFDHEYIISDECKLYLLVEKDFQCLVPRPHENEQDNFTNPLANLNC